MKIEIGESLLLSWLKHIKECQIVQTNWKPSKKWQFKNKEVLIELMNNSNKLFLDKYGYDLYKGNASIEQLIQQAEIDVVGISFDEDSTQIYAIDVAFHEAGLNYGSREETVTRIIKKCLRTAMCIYGYYSLKEGTIIFTSPKINQSVLNDIIPCIEDMNTVLDQIGLNYKIRVIANDEFNEKILAPVLNVLDSVADTSELFMRSLQMYNMFAEEKQISRTRVTKGEPLKKIAVEFQTIEYEGIDGLGEMKIGAIVRTVLRKILENGGANRQEIEQMQTREYSKETFDIHFPLLQKASLTNYVSPKRYYSSPIKIYDEDYFVCSEWYETPANNDRPYLLTWLKLNISV